MSPGLVLALAGWACLIWPVVAQADTPWPELPEPPRSHVEWVAQDVRVNGLHSRILKFESELSVTEVVDFFQRRWQQGNGQVRPLDVGGWRGVTALAGPFQFTLQAKPQKPQGSTGMISVADVVNMQRQYVPADWPTFADTKIVQVTESLDGPRRSVLVHQVSTSSFSINVDRWRRAWQGKGYALTREADAPNPGTGERQWMAFFDKGGETADVTVYENRAQGRTAVAVNRIKAKESP